MWRSRLFYISDLFPESPAEAPIRSIWWQAPVVFLVTLSRHDRFKRVDLLSLMAVLQSEQNESTFERLWDQGCVWGCVSTETARFHRPPEPVSPQSLFLPVRENNLVTVFLCYTVEYLHVYWSAALFLKDLSCHANSRGIISQEAEKNEHESQRGMHAEVHIGEPLKLLRIHPNFGSRLLPRNRKWKKGRQRERGWWEDGEWREGGWREQKVGEREILRIKINRPCRI